MYRHHNDGIGALVVFIDLGHKRVLLKESRERRSFCPLAIIYNARNKLLDIIESVLLLLTTVDKHLTVARAVKHLIHKGFKRDVCVKKSAKVIYQLRKTEESRFGTLQRNVAVCLLYHLKHRQALLRRYSLDSLYRGLTYLSFRLVNYSLEPFVVTEIIYHLKVSENVPYLLAVVKPLTAKHSVRDSAFGEGALYRLRLNVGAVQYSEIAEAAAAARHRLVYLVNQIISLAVLILTALQFYSLSTLSVGKQSLTLSALVVGYHLVCRVKYLPCGTVILLQTYHPRARVGLVKFKNIRNIRAPEFINTLIVVTDHHNVSVARAEHFCKFELREVGVLIFVNANVSEFSAIIIKHLFIVAQKEDSLHNDVVVIKRVTSSHLLLIAAVYPCYLAQAVIPRVFKLVHLGSDKTLLGFAYLRDNRLNRQSLIVYPQLLHNRGDRLLCIVGVIDGKSGSITYTIAVFAEYSHTYRVKCARPHRGSYTLIVERRHKSALYLTRRLVGKGYGEHLPRCAGRGNKFGQYLLYLGACELCRRLKPCGGVLGNPRGYSVTKIRISVFYNKRDPLDEHGSLSASRPREDEQRSVCCKDRFPLHIVKV